MIKRFIRINLWYRPFSTTSAKCDSRNEVRVRFAPSPTGNIHLGGLRTALYNYIFAKQNSGKFVLRIEDTDQSRLVANSAKDIENVLCWAGLNPNESPTVGGGYGPYTQSKRLDLYKQRAEELIETGRAYRCFCSPERLDLLRKYQMRNRQKPRYDGKCRHLSSSEIDEMLSMNNGRHVIRYAIEPKLIQFDDLIFGDIANDFSIIKDSDPVLLKSDNFPTYHFANVVDDHEMQITHVLRGSEWISSTAMHVQLYQAFGWIAPKFAHFPLITLKGGSKISKRNNENHVKSYIEAGYKPLAILNFLTNMGGGLPKEKQDSMELWDLDRIVEEFDFSKVLCNPGSIDMEKLKIYNMKELQKMWYEDKNLVQREVRVLLEMNNIPFDLDAESFETIIEQFIHHRIVTLNDLISPEKSFIWHHPSLCLSLEEYHDKGWNLKELVESIIIAIRESNIEDKSSYEAMFVEITSKYGIDKASLMRLIRKLLTNSDKGLPVFHIFLCLGKKRLLDYLEKSLKYIN